MFQLSLDKLRLRVKPGDKLLELEPDLVVRPLTKSEHVTSISLSLASPETVMEWSYGEISDANTFDAETGKPVVGGLFCPRVFGSISDRECLCEKPPAEGATCCEECGVELGVSWKTARSRFGHIELAVPVVHT